MGKVLGGSRAQGFPVAFMGTPLDCPSSALTLAQLPSEQAPLSRFLTGICEWLGGALLLGLVTSDR